MIQSENLTFNWITCYRWLLDTFWKGYKRDLETTDIYAPLKEHKSDYLGDKFEKWVLQLLGVDYLGEFHSLCHLFYHSLNRLSVLLTLNNWNCYIKDKGKGKVVSVLNQVPHNKDVSFD